MSDGPHRSLPFNPHWKKVAERADLAAFDPSEIAGCIPDAVLTTCRAEAGGEFFECLKSLVKIRQGDLFAEQRACELFREIRQLAAGSPSALRLVEQLELQCKDGHLSEDKIIAAVTDGLRETAFAYGRQIEEIYIRKQLVSDSRAKSVRKRIEEGIAASNLHRTACELIGLEQENPYQASPKADLDDGPSYD